ncbi:hypothetical protein L0222_25560 [bacterium]|nr:hypothetical protein [bacterium]MCI0606924.1 hypothetical protein [bacterium]
MKAGRSVDGIVYPDVGQQISDLVSQQPGEAEAPEIKAVVPRRRVDEYKAIVSTGYSRLDQLLRKEFPPLSTFGFIPRPAGWQTAPDIFHHPQIRRELNELFQALGADTKLQELADDLVADSEDAPINIQHFLTAGFRGLVFPADVPSMEDPLKFIRERSLHSLDELRQKLFDGRTSSSEKASALLQFRSKLDALKKLGEFIQNSFADLDYLELSRVKAPLLC